LAKVSRDNFVEEWCLNNKDVAEKYDLIKSKGYGTKKHREGLKEHGPHEFHRKLFIRNWI
jgi:ribonuclease HII